MNAMKSNKIENSKESTPILNFLQIRHTAINAEYCREYSSLARLKQGLKSKGCPEFAICALTHYGFFSAFNNFTWNYGGHEYESIVE